VVHTDSRTLAATSSRGLHFFDIVTGEELASVRLAHWQTDFPVFFDGPCPPPGREGEEEAGGWVTGGLSGLILWPARPDLARPGVLRVGPPRPLAPGLKSRFTEGASASRDARIVAVPDGEFTTVIHRDRPGRRLKLGPQYDLRFTAVSPDGRWVVTGSHWEDHRSPSARIWDALSGKLLHELPLEGSTPARFSPDGRWLMTSSRGGCRLWEAGAWREVRRFDAGRFAFGPDGRLLAVGDVFGVIRLVETATGREVARLTGPDVVEHQPVCFTGDGTRLIAHGSGAARLYVWDLRLIREQLKEMGLDWDWPDFGPPDPGSNAEPPQVEVLLGDQARPVLTPEQKARQAIAHFRRAVEANPDDAAACNDLAWVYVTGPEALRDVKAALPLAEKAVRLAPNDTVFRNTLGVAYYRAGRHREAAEAFRANLDSRENWALAFDLYFLAMSHHHLGEAARARDYYDWAVRWPQTHPKLTAGHLEELDVFRAEAAKLLGIDKKKK
jgi:hypothetical protein